MTKSNLHKAILRFLTLPAIGNAPVIAPQGNLIDAGNFTAWASYISLYGNANANFSAVTNASTTALALTAANCAQGIVNAIVVASGGSANTNTTDTATNIITTFWPTGLVGSRAALLYVNNNSGTNTLAGGTGVTITGTATVPTLALAYYGLTITNLANPAQVGAVSTNSTTTTAAVATGVVTGTAAVIPVTSATGINVGGYLKVTLVTGATQSSRVTAINSLNITLADPLTAAVASGATVLSYNNTLTMLRLFSTVTATTAA